MLKAEQVPTAACNAFSVARINGEKLDGCIAAALNAWPGVVKNYSWDASHGRIILPLPQEGE